MISRKASLHPRFNFLNLISYVNSTKASRILFTNAFRSTLTYRPDNFLEHQNAVRHRGNEKILEN